MVIERVGLKTAIASYVWLWFFTPSNAFEYQWMSQVAACISYVLYKQLVFDAVQAICSRTILSVANIFSEFHFLARQASMPSVFLKEEESI